MDNKTKVIVEAILNGNMTLLEVANSLNISKSTIQKRLQALKESDPVKYSEVREKIDSIAKTRYGMGIKGKRTSSYDSVAKEILEKLEQLYNNQQHYEDFSYQSLRELEKEYGIPKSSLYDRLIKCANEEQLKMLKYIFSYNNTIGKRTISDRKNYNHGAR